MSGYFPASFTEDDAQILDYNRIYAVAGDRLPGSGSNSFSFNISVDSQFYVEVLFSVPAPLTVEKVTTLSSTPYVNGRICLSPSAEPVVTSSGLLVYSADISRVVDGNLYPLEVFSGNNFTIPNDSFEVNRYWGYRFYFNPFDVTKTEKTDLYFKVISTENNVVYTFSDPNYQAGILNGVTVNTGILQEINGNLTDIKTSTIQIQQDISDIKDTVTDTSEQLQNPSSNIWQAAGSTISGAIESLFVPSEQDIAAVKDGFDQLAQDKLGGAYTAMETVDSTLEQVNDKLNNPSAAEGVEFPGISVPLGGEIGTVTLLEAQMVTMPVQLTTVLHPIAGTIVSIVCGLGTFNVLKDMVECFLSGFSYSEFLHRNKGGSDE